MSIRYARQEALWGEKGQQKLADSHVAVIGAGGLGSPALLYLAGAGVGRLSLFDDDIVSPSNLHRQVIHTTASIGTAKTASAAATVHALNPEVDLICHGRLESATALKQLRGCTVILDGTDNFDARYLCSWAAHSLGIPHIWASILGFDAQMSVFWSGKGPVYEDVFPTAPAPGEVPSCFQGHRGSHRADDGAQNAGLGTRRNLARSRGGGEDILVHRALAGPKDAHLRIKAQDRSPNMRNA